MFSGEVGRNDGGETEVPDAIMEIEVEADNGGKDVVVQDNNENISTWSTDDNNENEPTQSSQPHSPGRVPSVMHAEGPFTSGADFGEWIFEKMRFKPAQFYYVMELFDLYSRAHHQSSVLKRLMAYGKAVFRNNFIVFLQGLLLVATCVKDKRCVLRAYIRTLPREQ